MAAKIARRYDTFTLNVTRTDVWATIVVNSDDETQNDLSPGDEYEVGFKYTHGRPLLGNKNGILANGMDLAESDKERFATRFEVAFGGTIEGKSLPYDAFDPKTPTRNFDDDQPNANSGIDPRKPFDNKLFGTLKSAEAMFGDSTLAETSSLKDTAKLDGWIFCDQVWSEEITIPDI